MVYIHKIAREYLTTIPSHIKTSEFPLANFDVSKLEGYQKDFFVFNGVPMEDIAFITKNLDTINFLRGCNIGCLHCPKKATKPISGRGTILYEDFKNLILGLSGLSERLGFDILNGNKFIKISSDSEPIGRRVRGLKKDHKITEMIQFMYEHLKIPVIYKTSGWEAKLSRSTGYDHDIKSAKSMVCLVKNNPDSIKEVQVAINPFAPKSDTYVLRMADTLRVFLDLFKMNKAKIVYSHTKDPNTNFGEAAAKKLYENIYSKLLEISGINPEYFPELKPEFVTKLLWSHWIQPVGGAKRFLTEADEAMINKGYARELINWHNLNEKEKRKILFHQAKKCIDIDGSVYTEKPTGIRYSETPIDITIPVGIKLNFLDTSKPNPIYQDITFK